VPLILNATNGQLVKYYKDISKSCALIILTNYNSRPGLKPGFAINHSDRACMLDVTAKPPRKATHPKVLHINVTYCPEIVFCVYHQFLPVLILKRVDIKLFVKNGIKCIGDLSQNNLQNTTTLVQNSYISMAIIHRLSNIHSGP